MSVLEVVYSTLETEDTPEVYAFHLDIIVKKVRTIKKYHAVWVGSHVFLFIFSSNFQALGVCIYVVIL